MRQLFETIWAEEVRSFTRYWQNAPYGETTIDVATLENVQGNTQGTENISKRNGGLA